MDKKIVKDTVKINFFKKLLLPGTAIFMSFLLAACAGGGKAAGTGASAGQEQAETSGSETVKEPETSGTEAEESGTGAAVKEEETKKAVNETTAETKEQEGLQENAGAGMVNPVRQVDSSSDFESIGLKLELPVNDKWYSDPLFSIIGGRVAQIQFVDEITGSDAIARAGKSEDGDISGIYYVFDDSKKQSWFTKLEDGTRIDITVQVTAENSDVHGVLATWSYKDITYSLWEDDAWEYQDAVAKMAIEIMERSDPETEPF